ncbi:N-acetylglucosamine-6-phosphate deacetylase [Pseudoroseomonas wenyumeiae]|uniref:N-acetylglucosamine-6-phosphate deacetylase n=1 Tax=Teichococcus wenyumeiae TaxID=2478470 RepID=A0A3A9JHM8_9PROT|nr:N-acetylglucosamine-6-phosphate deacetylase [Pseudoroseomonas wenyumeiae]RKK06062.1 N-acetylglucosamine-6-phosphate deacetylase [Pseudoroseomonas wenyumeiae]RMI19578.1 N-acetylglucosamine-6-phosphate deacetylase [Pseudoroseomonas wenyumeiae]
MISGGLVDLQVNGFGGVDFNAAADAGPLSAAALDVALEAMLATGVTCCLPTVITAAPETLRARLQALDAAVAGSRLGPLMCPGYHLEGPFLNATDGFAGCHPPEAMIPPDYALLESLEAGLSRPILLLTLAAELPGAEACIQAAHAAGKLVAIGHSNVTFRHVAQAVAAGASLSTHLGNGLPQVMPKLANPIFAQLAEDRLSAGFIADGIHLPPPALKAMIRAKGPGRAFLVTDATAAAAVPAGIYPFAGMRVERSADGTVRTPGGRYLAGSSLCMDAAVRNLVEWGIATPEEALGMASSVQAGLLAPALAAHGIALPHGEAEWSSALRLTRIRIGSAERRFTD